MELLHSPALVGNSSGGIKVVGFPCLDANELRCLALPKPSLEDQVMRYLVVFFIDYCRWRLCLQDLRYFYRSGRRAVQKVQHKAKIQSHDPE